MNTRASTTYNFTNCTLYTSGQFMGNYTAYPCKWVKIKIAPCAQYQAAIHVTFLPKGKRKPRYLIQDYKPSLVIAEGWNTPKPGELFNQTISIGDGFEMKSAPHRAFSEGWKNDFFKNVMPHLTVLADFHGHNAHDKFKSIPQ